jgi:beta-galactosidase
VSGTDVVLQGVNREYEQAQRHWQQVNAAYLKPDNAGVAVWCFADYNTFHNSDEPGLVWHGVVDLFRIPKFSYGWHQSELAERPKAYVVRVDKTHATVFSNCQRVKLWENIGQGFVEVATQAPPRSFKAQDGTEIRYALHHPPLEYGVNPRAVALRAEGLIGNSVRATSLWKEAELPVALSLEVDRPQIQADGGDLSRIIVSVVDKAGVSVETAKGTVAFSVEGLGQIIGENPAALRAGKAVVLVQSGYVPGKLRVKAEAAGLGGASGELTLTPLPATVDVPQNLPAKQPTARHVVQARVR